MVLISRFAENDIVTSPLPLESVAVLLRIVNRIISIFSSYFFFIIQKLLIRYIEEVSVVFIIMFVYCVVIDIIQKKRK